MAILRLFVCGLCFWLCQDNEPWIDNSDSVDAAAVLIVIDPVALTGDGLLQSWQDLDEPFGKRHIQGRLNSNVHFALQPMDSSNGAALNVTIAGTSVGDTTSKTGSRGVVTNAITQYSGYQTAIIDGNGLTFHQPVLDIKTSQSFNRVESPDGQFANSLGRAGFRMFEKRYQAEADVFSHRQVHRQVYLRNLRTAEIFAKMQSQLNDQFELVNQLQWHFSSDKKNIYITSLGGDFSVQPPIASDPVTVMTTAGTINLWLKNEFADRTLDAEAIRESFARFTRQDESSESDQIKSQGDEDEEDWFVHLGEDPITIELGRNEILGQISAREFSSGGKSLYGMAVSFQYLFDQDSDKWFLRRDGEIDVRSTTPGQTLSARQRVLRTVMRKRFEKILPEIIELPRMDSPFSGMNLDVALTLNRIESKNGWLTISFTSE